ncbi:cell division protein ZapE, partial [Streptomyces sp. NPDC057654]
MSPSTTSESSTAPDSPPIAGSAADGAPLALTARAPHVPADRLVAEMVPPPRFGSARFDTYIPDPNQPSQAEAVTVLSAFAAGLGGGASAAGGGKKRW